MDHYADEVAKFKREAAACRGPHDAFNVEDNLRSYLRLEAPKAFRAKRGAAFLEFERWAHAFIRDELRRIA